MTDDRDERMRVNSEWRERHLGTLLTPEEVAELPSGSRVEIIWSGGNGPHQYTIHQTDYGTFWRSDRITEEHWPNVMKHQDPIRFVGSERFHTLVRLVGSADYEVSDDLKLLLDETNAKGPAPGSTVVEVFTEWAMRYEIDNDCEAAGLVSPGYTASISSFMAAAYHQCIDQGLLRDSADYD